MLVTGLSSSVFWPITAALSGAVGWRATLLIYGAAMVLVCFPLHVFGLPQRRRPPAGERTPRDERTCERRAGASAVCAAGHGDCAHVVRLMGYRLDHHSAAQVDGRRRCVGAPRRLAAGRHSGQRACARLLRRALERPDHGSRRRDRDAGRLRASAAGRAGRLGHRRLHAALWRLDRCDGGRPRDHAAGVLRCRRVRTRVVAHRLADEPCRCCGAAASGGRSDQLRQQRRAWLRTGMQPDRARAAIGARAHASQGAGVRARKLSARSPVAYPDTTSPTPSAARAGRRRSGWRRG